MKEGIEALVPSFYEWPARWMGMPEDLEYGQRLLKYFELFVFELVTGRLAKKTKTKHVDNVWLAGGELIRRVSMGEEYDVDPKELILDHFSDDGGPYCRHLETDQEMNAYDSSCRKFYKLMERLEEV